MIRYNFRNVSVWNLILDRITKISTARINKFKECNRLIILKRVNKRRLLKYLAGNKDLTKNLICFSIRLFIKNGMNCKLLNDSKPEKLFVNNSAPCLARASAFSL